MTKSMISSWFIFDWYLCSEEVGHVIPGSGDWSETFPVQSEQGLLVQHDRGIGIPGQEEVSHSLSETLCSYPQK